MRKHDRIVADIRGRQGRINTVCGIDIIVALIFGAAILVSARGAGYALLILPLLMIYFAIIDYGKLPPPGPGKRAWMTRSMQRWGYSRKQIDNVLAGRPNDYEEPHDDR